MSTTNNNAPFAEGQKIVAVKDSVRGYFKKGDWFEVLAQTICFGCGCQYVYVGKTSMSIGKRHCSRCDHECKPEGKGRIFHDHNYFAPINPSYYDATQSILEQFRKDEAVKDRVDSPVKEIINQ